MLVNNEVKLKLAMTTPYELLSLFKSSLTKEKESLITRELVEIEVRKGRDDPYWISRKNSLELIELSSIKFV